MGQVFITFKSNQLTLIFSLIKLFLLIKVLSLKNPILWIFLYFSVKFMWIQSSEIVSISEGANACHKFQLTLINFYHKNFGLVYRLSNAQFHKLAGNTMVQSMYWENLYQVSNIPSLELLERYTFRKATENFFPFLYTLI